MRWSAAMARALYGPHGFFVSGAGPAGHFRTSANSSPVLANAVLRLLQRVDEVLGRPRRLDFVDVGAGRGELVTGVLALAPTDLRDRLHPVGVELAARPAFLDAAIDWRDAPPAGVTGLLIATEWLDNVPLDVVEQTAEGPRLVMVNVHTGEERIGGPLRPADRDWLEQWWPLGRVGSRAEIGRPRDEAWASVLVRLNRGRAIAIDYAHPVDNRPLHGTLTGYRDGAVVVPVPDGTCDITAHVALDACAAAGIRAGAISTTLSTQREALRKLGLTGTRPPLDLARTDPRGYLRALTRASEEGELIDASGLGGFGWLSQDK
jgi:SAM-dependent MidA family methyltransferase